MADTVSACERLAPEALLARKVLEVAMPTSIEPDVPAALDAHAAAMRVLATAERLPIIVTVTSDSNSHRHRMFSDANLL